MSLPPTSAENTLGPYRLLRTLGQGGMGTVYLAHDDALHRPVAIKVLRVAPDAGRPAGSLAKRFLREAQSAAKLNHPNVVTIYSVGQHASAPYIVMEYIEGGSLADHLRQHGPMHWRAAAAVLRDALRALAAAHQAGIVHRDIKPANLLRSRNRLAGAADSSADLIKLVDFGLARLAAGPVDADLTFPGAFVGSPSYASPEQIAGSSQVDGRADLYSLAATAFALLTGQPPFVEEDPADVMDHHLHRAFPDVRTLSPTVPAAFQELIARASQKQPEQRFASAEKMLETLELLFELSADIVDLVPRKPLSPRTAGSISPAEQSVLHLESRLSQARQQSDSTTQLATLRTLYGLYAQLDRRTEAIRAFREALVLHVKLHAPAATTN